MRHGLSFLFNAFAEHLARGLTFGSSWIIHLYTNDRIRMIWPVNRLAGQEALR
jgi:hypothetical protein